MRKLVVIEGPDGSGKSTLVKALAAMFGWPVHHSGGPPRTKADLERKFTDLEAALSSSASGLVLDRHPAISEPIYRAAAGEVCMMTPAVMLYRLAALKPVVVYCRLTSMTEMWQSIDRSSKPHKPAAHLEQVLRDYQTVVSKYDLTFSDPDLGFPVLRYNWKTQPLRHLVENIKLCAD